MNIAMRAVEASATLCRWHRGNFSKNNASQLPADNHLAISVNPCTRKTHFAISRPIVLTVCMIGSSESWGVLNNAHFHDTHVPVEEPSTASKDSLP